MTEPLLIETRKLSRHFAVRTGGGRTGVLHAVDGVDLAIPRATIVGLVGESGSGKTTLARLVSLYYSPTSGEVLLDGAPVSGRNAKEAYSYRADVQLMFQDPFSSLNSVHTVRYTLGRILRANGVTGNRVALERRLTDLLGTVRLDPAAEYLDKYPHELSGGQRQRVVLARALAVTPKVILADEPVSMLDVSIRAEMLNLLASLRDEHGLSLLYVTHDIAGARYLCDRIVVMYAGRIAEEGSAEQIVSNPQHPYTQRLVASSPDPTRTRTLSRRERFGTEEGPADPPTVIDPQPGCRFAPRCSFADDRCRTVDPPTIEVRPGQRATCWLYDGSRRPAPTCSGPDQDQASTRIGGAT